MCCVLGVRLWNICVLYRLMLLNVKCVVLLSVRWLLLLSVKLLVGWNGGFGIIMRCIVGVLSVVIWVVCGVSVW